MIRKVIVFPSLLFRQDSGLEMGASWSRHEEELGSSHLCHPHFPSRPFPPRSVGVLFSFHLVFFFSSFSPSFLSYFYSFFRLCLFFRLSLSPCLAPSYSLSSHFSFHPFVFPFPVLTFSFLPCPSTELQFFKRPNLFSLSNFTSQHLANVTAVYS